MAKRGRRTKRPGVAMPHNLVVRVADDTMVVIRTAAASKGGESVSDWVRRVMPVGWTLAGTAHPWLRACVRAWECCPRPAPEPRSPTGNRTDPPGSNRDPRVCVPPFDTKPGGVLR